jgi:hypothetical protein
MYYEGGCERARATRVGHTHTTTQYPVPRHVTDQPMCGRLPCTLYSPGFRFLFFFVFFYHLSLSLSPAQTEQGRIDRVDAGAGGYASVMAMPVLCAGRVLGACRAALVVHMTQTCRPEQIVGCRYRRSQCPSTFSPAKLWWVPDFGGCRDSTIVESGVVYKQARC